MFVESTPSYRLETPPTPGSPSAEQPMPFGTKVALSLGGAALFVSLACLARQNSASVPPPHDPTPRAC